MNKKQEAAYCAGWITAWNAQADMKRTDGTEPGRLVIIYGTCPECGGTYYWGKHNYCPNCGAKVVE